MRDVPATMWWKDHEHGRPQVDPWTPAMGCRDLLADLIKSGIRRPAEVTPSRDDGVIRHFSPYVRASGASSSASWAARD